MQGLTYVPPSASSSTSASATSVSASVTSTPTAATAGQEPSARVSNWVVLVAVVSIFAPLFFVFLGVVCAGLCSHTRTMRRPRSHINQKPEAGGSGDGAHLSARFPSLSDSTEESLHSQSKSEYPPVRAELHRFDTVDLEAGPTEGQLPMYTR